MPRSEHALNWDGATVPGGVVDPLALPINRRHLLTIVGATAASVVLAGSALPISSAGGSAAAVSTLSLAALEVNQFLALIGETFTAQVLTGENPDNRASFVLSDVTVLEAARGERRPAGLRSQPFSLLFLLGSGSPGESGIVRFTHDALGKVELFVHQVLSTDDGPAYEAVLN